MSEKERFDLANNIEFLAAWYDKLEATPPLQKNPMQSIEDRMIFIEALEKRGFIIVKGKSTFLAEVVFHEDGSNRIAFHEDTPENEETLIKETNEDTASVRSFLVRAEVGDAINVAEDFSVSDTLASSVGF